MTKALLISERPPNHHIHPGYALRVKDLRDWMEDEGFQVEMSAIVGGLEEAGQFSRVLDTLRFRRTIASQVRGHDLVVVAALGSPHMVWLAGRLRAPRVVLDLCDGLNVTFKAQVQGRMLWGAVKTLIGMLALLLLPRSVAVTYITEYDCDADRWTLRGRSRCSIGPRMRANLRGLSPFTGPAVRIVMPADLRSPHNLEVFTWLLRAVERAQQGLPPIEIYGPSAPLQELPPGMVYKGWAERLESIYEGATVVLAPNRHRVGVQNKVWEAVTAGRPVVTGADIAEAYDPGAGVYGFRNRSDLIDVLRAACQVRSLPSTMHRAPSRSARFSDLFEEREQ